MQELLNNWIPNVMSQLPDFYKAIGDTLLMVVWSGAISFVLGLALGVLLTVTKPGGILQNRVIYQILDKLVSLFRSIPFIILLTWVLPVSRAIMGTAIYVRGAIVPLVFGAVPFFARIAESAFSEVDPGLLEAAISTGATTRQIIVDAVFPQALPSFIRGVVLTIISLIGYSAMVGTIGAGGIGDMAIQYGYNRYETGVLVVIVIILIVIVQIIQWIGDWFARKVTH